MARVGLWVSVLAACFVAVVVNAQPGPIVPHPEPSFICEHTRHDNGALLTRGNVFDMLMLNYKMQYPNLSTEDLKAFMALADDDRDEHLSNEECEKLLKHLNSKNK